MRLYIANVTRQEHIVCYRLGASAGQKFTPHKQQPIPAGRQVQVGGDFTMPQIDEIVHQLAPYGMIGVVDVPRLGKNIAPLVYNIDRPVSTEVMRKVRGGNELVMIEDGSDRRRKAAVAANNLVQQAVAEEYAKNNVDQEPPDKTEVTFEQLDQSEEGEKRIEEGYRVQAEPGQGKAAPSKRSTRRKAKH